MSLDQFVIASGFVGALVVFLLRARKSRTFDGRDMHPVMQAFLAACNIPVGIYLCVMPFFSTLSSATTHELQPLMKYIALAGLSLLLLATLSFYSALKADYRARA